MRLKYQLRGLGIGLIITTIILTISHNVREIEANSKSNIQPTESTGSILAFDKDAESSREDSENNTEAKTQADETQTEQTGKIITVDIKDVHYASQAVDILYDAGVITDKDDFVDYLNKTGYSRRICEGVYEIKQGDSYETIAKIICREN